MEEMIDNDVDGRTDGTHIRTKERDFLLKPGAHEMVTPVTDDYPQDRVGSSEHASSSPRCMDSTVEELTLKNYDGEKLTIVGSSDHKEKMKKRSAWQHLYQIGGGSKSASNALGDNDSNYFSELLDQNQSQQNDNSNAIICNLGNTDKGIRTKILSKSGFSEFFVKTTLRGKGEIHKILVKAGELNHPKSDHADPPKSTPLDLAIQSLPLLPSVSGPHPLVDYNINNVGDGISLREWLGGSRNKVESLRIFRLVLDFVNISHSNGVPLQDLRPSFFKLLGSLQLIYIGSSVHVKVIENVAEQGIRYSTRNRNEKRHVNPSMLTVDEKSLKKRNSGENMNIIRRWPQFPSRSGGRITSSGHVDDVDAKPETKNQSKFFGQSMHKLSQESYTLEEKWYSCPELFKEKRCTFASNIYCLGILLFELLASFDSGRSHAAAMQDLRHRILPPRFLSENPKEAGFCLWLLHPEPSLRPSISEILQSEFISGVKELPGNTLSSSMDDEEKEEKSELLLYFLLALNEQKQKSAANLVEQINRIETDIQEIEKRRPEKWLGLMHGHKETRLTGNIGQLESAYFSTRSNVQSSDVDKSTIRNIDLLKIREKMLSTEKEEYSDVLVDHLGGFYDGLCKYARYKKFKVRGILRNGEFNNSIANVICSLSFDRDENYLAAGGVSKKIKIYEFQALFNDSVDVHYPAVEMANKSKLSCICWNGYIRNYLASTDYDGIVKLWDASTGQGFCNLSEHSARAWSVDFSRVDPMKLASGSDDRLVKVWSINDKNSLCTIRNNANICSVQFSNESSHMLAFSSADYKVYCYDLRNASVPWCVLAGHEKAVSYVKFLDGGTVVSASTDNTLKIWDLSKTSSNSLSRDACAVTLKGHTNEKNFVGLSVADGYITCGSETNEVYAYYKSLPMPITSHKFGSIDPTTGKETQDDNGQFVSSVCWRKKSNMVVAANSSGSIKLLEMV